MINVLHLLVVAALVSSQINRANGQLFHKRKLALEGERSGSVKRRISNNVRILESFPESVQFTPGTNLILTCEVGGTPAPSVHWLRNGELVDEFDQDDNEILTPHPNNTAILVSKLVIQAAESGDEISCIATAGSKHDAATTTIYVEPGDEVDDIFALRNIITKQSQPVISTYYDTILQLQDTSLILPCRVTSFTKTQVIWEDNNNRIIYGDSRKKVLPSGDLLLTDINFKQDMGGYTCIAKNAFGKDNVTTFLYPLKKEKIN